jgi:hypothetical protein
VVSREVGASVCALTDEGLEYATDRSAQCELETHWNEFRRRVSFGGARRRPERISGTEQGELLVLGSCWPCFPSLWRTWDVWTIAVEKFRERRR